jgi:hypothetical protein
MASGRGSKIVTWQSFIEIARQFIASNSFETLVAGAFGAFFGAWGAQAVITRNQTKLAVITELNSANAAFTLCFSICNKFLSLKRQHIRPMRDRYMATYKQYIQFQKLKNKNDGSSRRVFELHADLQTISPVKVPTEILEKYAFEKISIRGRVLAAAVDLVSAIDSLDKSIKYRNDLIAEIQQAPPPPEMLILWYFGQRNAEGIVDERFRMNIKLYTLTPTICIFFSRILADDLYQYAARLRRQSAWRLRLSLPKLDRIDWSIAERANLIHPTKDYASWLRGFEKKPTKLSTLRAWMRSFWRRAF